MLKIPLEQISYMQDDYQPSNFVHSPPATRALGGTGHSKIPLAPASNNGGGGAEEWDDDPVQDGFRDEYNDQEYDQEGGGYDCE